MRFLGGHFFSQVQGLRPSPVFKQCRYVKHLIRLKLPRFYFFFLHSFKVNPWYIIFLSFGLLIRESFEIFIYKNLQNYIISVYFLFFNPYLKLKFNDHWNFQYFWYLEFFMFVRDLIERSSFLLIFETLLLDPISCS